MEFAFETERVHKMRRRHVRLTVAAIPGADDERFCVFHTPLLGSLYLEGQGHLDDDCGRCGTTLMRGMRSITGVSGVVFICPSCHCGNITSAVRREALDAAS
ncbi:hypothetical protein GIS00_26495 [Nakamurella sp. YIM 132087]|uniref:Uncharacterized protein n=1 Tax=Nakamurella alba TaxID=2665158 RepID=A0A7K1FXC7_9ACTN|nr:hypothetical protein [Nakamurella alba]MTD17484.1 hypothetical protein [Nakamurella alba]